MIHQGLQHPQLRPITLWRWGLLPGGIVLLAVLGGLLAYGFAWWQAALWAAVLALPIPLRIHWNPRLGLLLSRLAWLAGPLLGYTLVEVLNYNSPWSSFTPLQVALNLAFYYLLALVCYLLFGRRRWSAGLSTSLFWLVGMANHYIISFRGRTIFPGDLLCLGTAANVASSYNYTPDTVQVTTGLILALFLVVLSALPRQDGRAKFTPKLLLPAGAAALFLVVFFGTSFLSWAGIEPSMWTTRGNGFVLNFSVCLRYSAVPKPAGYRDDALAAIAASLPADLPPEGTQPVNLIVVMNESFSDLSQVADLPVNQDYLPFYRSLTENTVKGTAYASVFGGTTANSEYEFLTGHSMAFLPAGTVPFQLYVKPDAASLVGQMNALGYRSIAMHPYLSSGWNRIPVYRDLGFSKSLFQPDFTDVSYMRNYVTDQSNYENLIRQYQAKAPGEPLFLFNVTMQNHSAYDVPWRGLPKSVWLTGPYQDRFPTVDQYLSLIRESDKALQSLLDYFAQVEEPTMVLLFGDHQPQVATDFYTQVLGSADTMDVATAEKKQQVPFLIWANYDIPEQSGVELSLNYLSALLMETAGLPMTGYQQLLSTLRTAVPVVNAIGYQDSEGTWSAQISDLSAQAQAALAQYQQVQYNALFDPDHRMPGFFTLPQ